MRYFITFSYFGNRYHGWQRQPNALTVQEVMEDVLSTYLRRKITLVGAGRTDTGVHAKQMCAHFDCSEALSVEGLTSKLNAFLPKDIAVSRVYPVRDDAHARFDAVERSYSYWITEHKNPFYLDTAYLVKQPLDIVKMNKAAAILMEYDDFECFSKSNTDVRTYRCHIKKALWHREDDRLVFTITADRFLRNMVRAIVGTLINIGLGMLKVDDLREIIESKNRSNAGFSVPAKGLYLMEVKYPENSVEIDG